MSELAAKRILPPFARTPWFLRRLAAEASIYLALDHPGIPRVADFGEQDGELFLVTEYVDGVSCDKLLEAAAARGRPIPVHAALHIAEQVLAALEYAHDFRDPDGWRLGIVHRNVSPANILVSALGEVKLSGFGGPGLRDAADPASHALTARFGYMAPEYVGGWAIDGRSDLFSMGVVLYEMLTGKRLFSGRSDLEVLASTYDADLSAIAEPTTGLPLVLRLILASALAREPDDRFQRAQDFADAIRSLARHIGAPWDSHALRYFLSTLDIWPSRSGSYPTVRPPSDSGPDGHSAATPFSEVRQRG